jgi:hypothetical protein
VEMGLANDSWDKSAVFIWKRGWVEDEWHPSRNLSQQSSAPAEIATDPQSCE